MTDTAEQAPDQQPERNLPAARRLRLLPASLAFVIIAALCAATFGTLWVVGGNTGNSDAARYSAARDDVLRIGETAALDFTSVDYRHFDQYRKQVGNATTGALHDSLGEIGKYRKQLQDNQIVVQSALLQGAVTALDPHAGTASVLVVVKTVTHSKDRKQPQLLRRPMVLQLKKQGPDWKVSAIGGSAASSIPGQ